jgi:hypothetical protein
MRDERPIPARQCTATEFPVFSRATIVPARDITSRVDGGTPRSWIEKKGTPYWEVMAKTGFPMKAEFLDLPAFEKAHDDVDSFRSPTRDLIIEPRARARARHDCQEGAGGQVNPMNFGTHTAPVRCSN